MMSRLHYVLFWLFLFSHSPIKARDLDRQQSCKFSKTLNSELPSTSVRKVQINFAIPDMDADIEWTWGIIPNYPTIDLQVIASSDQRQSLQLVSTESHVVGDVGYFLLVYPPLGNTALKISPLLLLTAGVMFSLFPGHFVFTASFMSFAIFVAAQVSLNCLQIRLHVSVPQSVQQICVVNECVQTGVQVTTGIVYAASTTGSISTTSSVTTGSSASRSTTSPTISTTSRTSPLTTSAVTTSKLTTSPLTTASATTSPFTSSPLTTSRVTTAPITTAPATTSPLTSSPLTASPHTTSPLTTSALTTAPLTTNSLTTSLLTTSPRTTQALTSAPLTTARLTTSPLTTSPLTTSPLTTQAITSAALTTNVVTTGAATTGTVTTGLLTTSAFTTNAITTGVVTTAAITTGAFTTDAVTTSAFTTGAITTGAITTGAITTGALCSLMCQNGQLDYLNCKCDCFGNWTGQQCSECSLQCENSGLLDTRKCTCNCNYTNLTNWSGITCADCEMECTNNATFNSESCSCECQSFWSGKDCSVCSLQCSNEGSIHVDNCTCSCPGNWGGFDCTECHYPTAKCLNGVPDATCTFCECISGFVGDDCSVDVRVQNLGTLSGIMTSYISAQQTMVDGTVFMASLQASEAVTNMYNALQSDQEEGGTGKRQIQDKKVENFSYFSIQRMVYTNITFTLLMDLEKVDSQVHLKYIPSKNKNKAAIVKKGYNIQYYRWNNSTLEEGLVT